MAGRLFRHVDIPPCVGRPHARPRQPEIRRSGPSAEYTNHHRPGSTLPAVMNKRGLAPFCVVTWNVTAGPKTIFAYSPSKTAADDRAADLEAALIATGLTAEDTQRRITCAVRSNDPRSAGCAGLYVGGGIVSIVSYGSPAADPSRAAILADAQRRIDQTEVPQAGFRASCGGGGIVSFYSTRHESPPFKYASDSPRRRCSTRSYPLAAIHQCKTSPRRPT